MTLPLGEVSEFFSRHFKCKLLLSERFSAAKKENRAHIRQMIVSQRSGLSKKETSHILDLDQPTSLVDISISISHTIDLGGFVIGEAKEQGYGLDIELNSRITKEIVERVSKPEEVTLVPNYSLLWTAKESSFKAVSNRDNSAVNVLADVILTNMSPLNHENHLRFNAWTFRAQTSHNKQPCPIEGLTVSFENYSLSVARTFPSTLDEVAPN